MIRTMGAHKLHTIRILYKIINIRKRRRNGNELQIDMRCTLHEQQLVHEDFQHVASFGVAHHVNFINDDSSVVLERLCPD